MAASMMHALVLALALTGASAIAQQSPSDPMSDWLVARGLVPSESPQLPAEPNTAATALSGLVVHAMAYLDTPYRLGGNSTDEGLDCSGFVQAAYRHSLGIRLPRRAVEQAHATQSIPTEDLVPGDLVFFNTQGPSYSHVGIYVGDGRFIHAPRAGAQIRMERLQAHYWQTRFNGARRVDGLVASAPQDTVKLSRPF